MAKPKARKPSYLGAVLTAAVLGLIIGSVIYYQSGEPLPPPAEVEFTSEYDDSWGRLDKPVVRCGVTHILVKSEGRTDEEAKKEIERIWHLYRTNPTQPNWRELQVKYNEDKADIHAVFPIPGNLVPEFQEVGKSTKVGFARIAKSQFGYHLIRRES